MMKERQKDFMGYGCEHECEGVSKFHSKNIIRYLGYNRHFIGEKNERETRIDVKNGVESAVTRLGGLGVSS